MQNVLLIANPSASGFTGAMHRRVSSILGDAYDVTPVWPDSPAANRQACAEAAADGFLAVIAMGGDGVVHHAANGIANTATALGIIPSGTTNVVARIVGLPEKADKAAMALADASIIEAPLVHIATSSPAGARSEFAVFAAGVGFDADMVVRADARPTSKYHFGSLHYARSAASALLLDYRNRPANLRVTIDDTSVDAVAVLIQVQDPFTYFGRLPLRLAPAPEPGETRGPIVVAIESLRLARALPMLMRSTKGTSFGAVEGVHRFDDPAKVVIEAEPSSRFQADGELLGAADWIEVTPEPAALRLMVP